MVVVRSMLGLEVVRSHSLALICPFWCNFTRSLPFSALVSR